ncbi:hypothetical protein [Sphingobacterium yanglingense]|uniref:Lipoprotein n=1 Tax=Sphingobacterium yanglingense TaxID=1437280 RepID=A0A4R6W7Y4_9SPHI|nr:hypothetical protein [Sphingobacterium yanglingense]TDQ73521.1 hypothetical protein CLV99_4575 [Sphingobacterium yanglingense]
MKKFMKRNSFLAVMFFACASLIFASCSKDDDKTPSGIDAAIGTYIGKIEVIGGADYFDAIIKVSKVDDSHIKIEAKSGEKYSGVAAKTMKVSNTHNISINTLNEPNGSFLYSIDDKTVILLTEQTQKDEIIYSFKGTKQ